MLEVTKSHCHRHQTKREASDPPPWPGPSLSWQPPLAPEQKEEKHFMHFGSVILRRNAQSRDC